ncbi:MAG: hypothetical protein ACLFV4_07565 [Candidatus Hydrogenedentota bacterium]
MLTLTAMAVSGGLFAASYPLDFLGDPFQARLSQDLGGDVRFEGLTPHGFQGLRLRDLSVEIPLDGDADARLRIPSAVIELRPFELVRGRQGIHAIRLDNARFDVHIEGASGQMMEEQVPRIMQAFLDTPGLSVKGRKGAMRVYNQPGVPPLTLRNVEFDFRRSAGVKAISGEFHAQLGNTPVERLDARLFIDSRRHFDVFIRGNRLGGRTMTRLFPAASKFLLGGVFYPEVRISSFKDRWLMRGGVAFEGVEVRTPRHGFTLRKGTFQGAAAYARDSRELMITHARLDCPHFRGSAHGTMRFTDDGTEIDLRIDEVEFPPPLYPDKFTGQPFRNNREMTSASCPSARRMGSRTIAVPHYY